MKRLVLLALTGAALAWGSPAANAQGIGFYQRPATGPGYRPPVSPYMNLLRGNPGTSYYSLVRPQQETYRSLDSLQRGLQGLQQGASDPNAAPVGVPVGQGITGHSTRYFYYSHYYTFPFPRYGAGSGAAASPQQGVGTAPGTGTGSAFGAPIQNAPRTGIGIVIGG